MRWVYFDGGWEDTLQLDTRRSGHGYKDNPACRTHTDGTLVFWLTPNALELGRIIFGMSSQHNSGSNSYISLDLITAAANKLRIVRRDGTAGGSSVAAAYSASLVAGVRAHVAITSEMKMYINGVLVTTSGSIGAGWFAGLTATQWRMAVGGYRTGNSNGNQLDCKINQLLLLDRVLTSTEVAEAYNGGVVKDWSTYSFEPSITNAYEMEGDLTDSKGTDHLTGTNIVPASWVAS